MSKVARVLYHRASEWESTRELRTQGRISKLCMSELIIDERKQFYANFWLSPEISQLLTLNCVEKFLSANKGVNDEGVQLHGNGNQK